MKGFGAISPNNVGWMEKDRPVCGPMDAIIRPIAVAPCFFREIFPIGAF